MVQTGAAPTYDLLLITSSKTRRRRTSARMTRKLVKRSIYLSRAVVESPSLERFKKRVDVALQDMV